MPIATINRRKLLLGSGVLAALGVVGGATTVTMTDLFGAAADRPLLAGDGVVVIVTLYGGNDGISTVIPYGDNAYHDARGDLAYDGSQILTLTDGLGLNPAMRGLHDIWKRGSLAVVRGVGYPKPDHSHFRSMDIWQTAAPSSAVNTGWIGRWLDATGDDPLRAVSVGPVLPMLAVGEKSTAAALNTTGAGITAAGLDALTALGDPSVEDPRQAAAVSAVGRSYRAEQAVMSSLRSRATTGDADADADELAGQLAVVGRCVSAGVPTRVYSVSLGGFDTHADEKATQERLLGEFDSAVSGFLNTMKDDAHGRNVVVIAYSEFGRRVRANASEGTDHGTAGPVLIAGAPVRGGFYGDEPSLTDLDDGDLKVTTDFRDVYAELLDKAIGSDPTPAVGPGRTPVGFL